MKKTSEVCKLFGISRFTLRGYDEMNLLKPTVRTEAGYCLYDDDAIRKLTLIQTFVEVGYKRKEIKSILESSKIDLEYEYDKVISELEKKRERINAMITSVKMMKSILKLPMDALSSLGKISLDKFLYGKSFATALDEYIQELASFNEFEKNIHQRFMLMYFSICSIALNKEKNIDSEKVRNSFNDFSSFFWSFTLEEIEKDGNNKEDAIKEINQMSDHEFEEGFSEALISILNDIGPESIETVCGEGSFDFVKQVFTKYKLKRPIL